MNKKQKKFSIVLAVSLLVAFIIAGNIYFNSRKQNANENQAVSQSVPVATPMLLNQPVVSSFISNVPILVYHRIGLADPLASPEQKHYLVSPANFELQMQYLKDHGYTPITLNTLAKNILSSGTIILPNKPVVLTFDDGWRSQYQYAYPILKSFGFTATFFIITSYEDYPAYMTWDMVLDLDRAGMEIGSHTVHHLNLATISVPAAEIEIMGSKATLEAKLGHPITTLAYPDYGQNQVVQTLLKQAGYIAARAGWTSTANTNATIYNLKSQEAIDNPSPFVRYTSEQNVLL